MILFWEILEWQTIVIFKVGNDTNLKIMLILEVMQKLFVLFSHVPASPVITETLNKVSVLKTVSADLGLDILQLSSSLAL
jgi:hypothetical protein